MIQMFLLLTAFLVPNRRAENKMIVLLKQYRDGVISSLFKMK